MSQVVPPRGVTNRGQPPGGRISGANTNMFQTEPRFYAPQPQQQQAQLQQHAQYQPSSMNQHADDVSPNPELQLLSTVSRGVHSSRAAQGAQCHHAQPCCSQLCTHPKHRPLQAELSLSAQLGLLRERLSRGSPATPTPRLHLAGRQLMAYRRLCWCAAG